MYDIKTESLVHVSLGAFYSFPTPPPQLCLFLQHSTRNEHFNQFSPSDIMSYNNLTKERETNKHLQKVLNLEDGWEYILINASSQQLFHFTGTQCCHFGNVSFELFEMSKHYKENQNAKFCAGKISKKQGSLYFSLSMAKFCLYLYILKHKKHYRINGLLLYFLGNYRAATRY